MKTLIGISSWLMVSIVLVLAACSAPVVDTEDDVSLPAQEEDGVLEEEVVAEEEEAATNEEVEVDVAEDETTINEDGIMIGDDRRDGLRRLTNSWNTDWTRHTISYDEVLSGGVSRDGIPSVDNPQFESIETAEDWLAATEPVIALEINGEARAYPLSILTRHEIVNDELNGVSVAVTFCPLCNSALVFDRTVGGEVYEFGVSGLLRNSDLIMYDRSTESLWQQFTGEGIVGEHAGDQLEFIPAPLVSFDEFKNGYPQGEVLSRDTGIYSPASYGRNPYQGYDTEGSRPFLFRDGSGALKEMDPRLAGLARVVGVNINDEQVAYPYSIISEVGAVNDTVGGQDIVVFHRFGTNSALGAPVIATAQDVGATGAYNPVVDGQTLTFVVDDADQIVDEQTNSTWNLLGQATGGELQGTQLEQVLSTDHFWFSWAAFYPTTEVYEG